MLLTPMLKRAAGATLLSIPMVLATSAIALAGDITLMLHNQTSVDLSQLYVSPTTSDDWEENLISSGQLLRSKQSTNLTIADGRTTCEYDILGIFADGEEVQDYNVNLCDLESYSFIEE